MTACKRVVLVCAGPLLRGQKAYHCRDRMDLGVEDSTQDDACEEAKQNDQHKGCHGLRSLQATRPPQQSAQSHISRGCPRRRDVIDDERIDKVRIMVPRPGGKDGRGLVLIYIQSACAEVDKSSSHHMCAHDC